MYLWLPGKCQKWTIFLSSVRLREEVFEIQPQLITFSMHLSSLKHLVTTLKRSWSHLQINGNGAPHSYVFVVNCSSKCFVTLCFWSSSVVLLWCLHDNNRKQLFIPIFLFSLILETLEPGIPQPHKVRTCLYPSIWPKKGLDLCLEANSRHLYSNTETQTFSQVFSYNSFMLLFCAKGDASKSGSEINSCARSMEDVNGSKKDLSASASESDILHTIVHMSTHTHTHTYAALLFPL